MDSGRFIDQWRIINISTRPYRQGVTLKRRCILLWSVILVFTLMILTCPLCADDQFGYSAALTSVAFSPDGKILATGSNPEAAILLLDEKRWIPIGDKFSAWIAKANFRRSSPE